MSATNPSPGIVLNPDLTPELVEFWGFKYKELKQELDALKIQKTGGQEDSIPTYGELQRLVQQLQTETANAAKRLEANDKFLQDVIESTRSEHRAIQQQLEACNAEKSRLLAQVGRLEAERITLYNQIQTSFTQVASLAAEADRQRMAVIAELYPAVSFDDDSFTPGRIEFSAPKQLVRALQQGVNSYAWQFYFLPRPPISLPLYVPSPCQSGYWFYPFNLSFGSTFELIAELEPDKWLYFGRYTTRILPGYDMKLSEWLSLEEQLKVTFCKRIANQRLPAGQSASYANEAHIRQRYDAGQWSIPSYALQCVGYDRLLYDALKVTAAELRGESEPLNSHSLGKRRKTESPSRFEESENSDTSIEKTQHSATSNDGELDGMKGD
ncbi:hypothetical protein DFH07DRAFT_537734 [Mycena maculata]|uniref:DUF6697 domain-containing protein n=1 Tax=Mycena maculata TaxID=230809 RepID=A0AAD7K5F1_9AGAR|nr:hypothetical protein DFH07DRAFT_537734 [Mycena maculata]